MYNVQLHICDDLCPGIRHVKNMANWDEIKKGLKQKITEISDIKTSLLKEMPDDLLTRLERKLGKSREAILKIISEL
jgi:hypothetical protein